MATLAQLVDAIPVVQSTADRSNKFPAPALDQRVYNKATDAIERFGINGWQTDITFPGISADRGDASFTLQVGTDVPTQRLATPLTANRVITLSTGSLFNGAKFRIVRTGLGAFTVDVGPGLKTLPAGTAAYVDVESDGLGWFLTGYGTL